MAGKILIIGAFGQIGTELTLKLPDIYGNDQVVASDIREGSEELMSSGPFEAADATDAARIEALIDQYNIAKFT